MMQQRSSHGYLTLGYLMPRVYFAHKDVNNGNSKTVHIDAVFAMTADPEMRRHLESKGNDHGWWANYGESSDVDSSSTIFQMSTWTQRVMISLNPHWTKTTIKMMMMMMMMMSQESMVLLLLN